MRWQSFQLDNTVLKTIQALTLWQAEKGNLSINEKALAILVKLGEQEEGFIFHGQGKLLLDAIIETEMGAVGKSIERDLNEPFLMLGNTEKTREYTTEANEEDVAGGGYDDSEAFAVKAENLRAKFFEGKEPRNINVKQTNGQIFAFPNEDGEFDVLVAKDSKIVYKAGGVTFVSNGNKEVFKSPNEIFVSSNGKSVFLKNGKSVVVKKGKSLIVD